MKRILGSAAIVVAVASACYGHTWMSQWTPGGWTSCLGPDWRHGHVEDDPLCGEVFLLETRARENPEAYRNVLRAQWIGDVLGEKRADGMRPGSGDFWHSLAFQQQRIIASEVEAAAPPKPAQRAELEVTADSRNITTDKTGALTIPAAACIPGDTGAAPPVFMNSHDGGIQVHLPRQGKETELSTFTCDVELGKAGAYTLTAEVVTIHNGVCVSLSVTDDTEPLMLAMPYTVGMWAGSDPVKISLSQGRNTLRFKGKSGSNGVTIRKFILTPVNTE